MAGAATPAAPSGCPPLRGMHAVADNAVCLERNGSSHRALLAVAECLLSAVRHTTAPRRSPSSRPPHPQGATCDATVEESTAVPGAGLTALVDGRRLAAGTAALLAEHAGVEGPEVAAAQAAIDAEGALGSVFRRGAGLRRADFSRRLEAWVSGGSRVAPLAGPSELRAPRWPMWLHTRQLAPSAPVSSLSPGLPVQAQLPALWQSMASWRAGSGGAGGPEQGLCLWPDAMGVLESACERAVHSA